MATVLEPRQFNTLLLLLEKLGKLHEALADQVRDKTAAIRRADMGLVREIGQREHAFVEAINSSEGMRRQLMDQIGEQLGLPAGSARALSLTQVAARLGAAEKKQLLASGDKLRRCVARLANLNRVAGAVSTALVSHLRWVLASVRPKGSPSAAYAGDGAAVQGAGASILEVVG